MIPKKWAIKLNKEVKDWLLKENDESFYNWYRSDDAYFHYPNFSNGLGFTKGDHTDDKVRKDEGYEEIIIEQFRQYVLNKSEIIENFQIY